MAWDENKPNDFSRFSPSDIPQFLTFWETNHSQVMATMMSGSYVEGVAFPFMQAIASGSAPPWMVTLLRWRLAAQWAYQLGQPLGDRLVREGLIPVWLPGMPEQLRLTPSELAEIPPQLRAGFTQAMSNSMAWVKNLSNDARSHIRMLVSIQQLKNRNPKDVVAMLERVLRRDIIARELKIPVDAVDDQAIDYWLQQANEKVIKAIAFRANAISITESARAQNDGIFDSMELQGKTTCFIMPHRGTCPECRRLVDGRVFKIATLRENSFANFGKPKNRWVGALPQHPFCRHSPMDVPVKFRRAIAALDLIPDEGVPLQWYGLPGGKAAMESIGLVHEIPWLLPDGAIEQPQFIGT